MHVKLKCNYLVDLTNFLKNLVKFKLCDFISNLILIKKKVFHIFLLRFFDIRRGHNELRAFSANFSATVNRHKKNIDETNEKVINFRKTRENIKKRIES